MWPLAISVPRIAVYAAAVVGIFLAGMSAHKVFSDRKIAKLEAAQAQQIALWQTKVSEAQAAARQREAELQAAVDQHRTEADEALQSLRAQGALLAGVRVDADRLRKLAATYSAGRGSADSLSACQARADRLGALLADGGSLLEEGRDLVAACAVRADERAVKLRACLQAWPR